MTRAMRTFQDRNWIERLSGSNPAGPADAPPEEGSRVAVALELIARDPDPGLLVDLGCGDGALVTRVPPPRIGVDLSLEAIRRAPPEIPRIAADMDQPHIPLADGCAGRCALLDALPYVESPLRLLREIARILRPGGRLIVSTPNARQFRHVLALLSGRSAVFSAAEDPFEVSQRHWISDRTLRELLDRAGFECMFIRGLLPGGTDPLRRALRHFCSGGFGRAFLAPGLIAVGRRK